MVVITKRFGTYVSLRKLGLSLGKTLFLMNIAFFLKNNHVPRERNLTCPEGIT
jgi:hypothetical protein